jgi:LysR family cyn operon transcriptional activator
MKNIDHQLRLFLVIARTGSLSGAADVLDLTQSGLSKQLTNLETYIGHRLFDRHGRGVELTSAGEVLFEAAVKAYELVDTTVQRLRIDQGITEGRLRVATIHPLSYYFMPVILASFMAQRPAVNVSLFGRSSPEVVRLVERSQADIGFVYDEAVASDEVDSTFLFEEMMNLVVHVESPIAEESEIDLRDRKLPLVVFPPHYSLRRMLQAESLDALAAAEVETLDAMLKLVSLTKGQCILPSGVPKSVLVEHGLTAVGIAAPLLRRRVVAITRRGRPTMTLATLMLAIARSTTAEMHS